MNWQRAIVAALMLTGCSNEIELPSAPDRSSFFAAQKDAERYVGEGSQVVAICGSSSGGGVYLDNLKDGFEKDQIPKGQIIFVEDQNGEPNILTRDVSPELIVATEDGGIVSRLESNRPDDLGIWVIVYPETGVSVSHNLSSMARDSIVDLWVQNKPPVLTLPSRAQTFVASCLRPL